MFSILNILCPKFINMYSKSNKNNLPLKTRLSYNGRFIAEHFLGNTFFKSSIDKWANVNRKAIENWAKKLKPLKLTIPTYQNQISPTDFRRLFLHQGKPILIKQGAKNWKAFKTWDFNFFKQNYGNHPVLLTNHEDLGDNSNQQTELTDLETIIDGLAHGSKKYARFNPLLDVHPELKEDLDKNWLKKAMRYGLKNHHVLFIGNKGTKTNIHNAGNENIFVEIRGKKRWLLWDQNATYFLNPHVNRAPAKASKINPSKPNESTFHKIPYYECILEPGDIIFIPSYLWHYVENMTPTIGVGIRWISPINSIKNSPLFASLELFNTSPSIFTTLNWKNGFDFNKIIVESMNKKNRY